MSDTITMRWEDYKGKEQVRKVKQTLDARDFLGTAFYPWAIIAANGHLSAPDIEQFLFEQAEVTPGCSRSLSWIKRRRWICQPPGTSNLGNRDGKDERAYKLMAEHPYLSIRNLVLLLQENGIQRGRDWVMRNRVAHGTCPRQPI